MPGPVPGLERVCGRRPCGNVPNTNHFQEEELSNHAGRSKRLFAGFLAAVLAMTVAPIIGLALPAGAAPPPPVDPIGAGNFCEGTGTSEPFTDVQDNDPARAEIICLVATKITTGVTATTYEPNSFVTRRQMALFLVRTAAEADRLEIGDNIEELPAPAANTFTDVADESATVRNAISQLDQANVAGGFPDNTYRPEAPVTRRQMAAFIDRLYTYLTGAQLPRATEDYFADDNADPDAAESSTNAVARAGIFTGNTDGTFRPAQEITRRQMASVLTRFLQVLFENNEITKFTSATPTSNQTIAVPQEQETRNLNAPRTCQVSGLTPGASIDFALINTAQAVTTNGVTRFPEVDEDNTFELVENGARIVNINGAGVGPAQQVSNTVISPLGIVQVTFIGTAPGDISLLAFEDAAGLTPDTLDLVVETNSPQAPVSAPREAFGVGCRTLVANEAPGGDIGGAFGDVVVQSVSKDANLFNAGGQTFFYDANDTFTFGTALSCETESGTPVTLDQFEAVLSPGDNVNGVYATEPGLVSTFCIIDDSPGNPQNVTATSATPTSITLTIDDSATTTADSYNVYRVQRPANTGICPDFTTPAGRAQYTVAGTVADPSPGANAGTVNFTDTGLAPNTFYCYVVTTVDDGDESTGVLVDDGGEPGVQTAATNEAIRPQSVDAEITTNGAAGFADRLDAGDVLKVCFNEAMRAPDAGDAIEIRDNDGDIAVLTNGGNATFALGAAPTTDVGANPDTTPESCSAANTLVITITGAVTDQNANVAPQNGIINVPVTATDSAGVTDIVGNTWDIAASADKYFDFVLANQDDLEAIAP